MERDSLTKNVSEYIQKNKISLAKLVRETGISYKVLYSSLGRSGGQRELRASEFMSICESLGRQPQDFWKTKN